MNTREAIKAMAEGKKVEDVEGDIWEMTDDGCIVCLVDFSCEPFSSQFAPFTVHEEPATDAELVAEMVRIGAQTDWRKAGINPYYACAEMLRSRKVTP